MRAGGRARVTLLFLAAVTACGGPEVGGTPVEDAINGDSVDASKPGTVLRFGPADPEIAAGPVYPPVVTGGDGQVSIFEGFFVREPCALPLRVDASRQSDTIHVRVISEPDTTRVDCQEGERPAGYAILVGQFEPGGYAVRVTHDGDLARATPLDTVYEDITVRPNPR